VVAVRYLPDDSRLSVLPDDSFAHDGQITKQSMRAVTLAALACVVPALVSCGRILRRALAFARACS